MTFIKREVQEWHESKKIVVEDGLTEPRVQCEHCGAPAESDQIDSEFPLCVACDG
jgi:hypothetical protein